MVMLHLDWLGLNCLYLKIVCGVYAFFTRRGVWAIGGLLPTGPSVAQNGGFLHHREARLFLGSSLVPVKPKSRCLGPRQRFVQS